jgi:hypothetical protein
LFFTYNHQNTAYGQSRAFVFVSVHEEGGLHPLQHDGKMEGGEGDVVGKIGGVEEGDEPRGRQQVAGLRVGEQQKLLGETADWGDVEEYYYIIIISNTVT